MIDGSLISFVVETYLPLICIKAHPLQKAYFSPYRKSVTWYHLSFTEPCIWYSDSQVLRSPCCCIMTPHSGIWSRCSWGRTRSRCRYENKTLKQSKVCEDQRGAVPDTRFSGGQLEVHPKIRIQSCSVCRPRNTSGASQLHSRNVLIRNMTVHRRSTVRAAYYNRYLCFMFGCDLQWL